MHTYLVVSGAYWCIEGRRGGRGGRGGEEENSRWKSSTIARKLFTTKQSTKPERNAALKEWQNNYKLELTI